MCFAAGLTAATIAGDKLLTELKEGVILREYPFSIRSEEIGEIEFLSDNIFGPEGGVLLRSGSSLLFEPNPDPAKRFFDSGKIYNYVHRANRADVIERAHRGGANLIDVDVNNETSSLYAEHGRIFETQLKLGRQAIGPLLSVVVDMNEAGLTLGGPNLSYEDAVELIARISKDGPPVGMSIELKRGDFGPDEIYQILEIHQARLIPVRMHSPHPGQPRQAGEELASYYNVAA